MVNELLHLTKEYIIPENEQQSYAFFFDQTVLEKNITLSFFIKRNASFALQFLISNKNINLRINCFLVEDGASAHVRGACIVANSHASTITTLQHHQAPHTQSSLAIKGLVYDTAYMEYRGTITIDENSHTVSADLENKNIIMGESARIISVPNLQVLHNEVKCSHASAIGSLDQQQLFYLVSRGINTITAEKMLLEAFFEELNIYDEMKMKIERALYEHKI